LVLLWLPLLHWPASWWSISISELLAGIVMGLAQSVWHAALVK